MIFVANKVEVSEDATKARHRRLVQGVVVSNKMQKTVVVKVDRRVRHSQYGKFITISKQYKVHDEKNESKIGDRVEIIESRPLSRSKRWALRRVVLRSSLQ